jgi:acetyl-CoA carboxylase carboxyl transferase subunit alpha
MKLAEKFGRPVITLIDTPGAYPGIDAEERGQAEAIAFNLREMAGLAVPIIAVVLGEGGSGGALAIGIGDRVLMMENAVYSVITPEGCAAILWKDAGEASRAAESLRLTAGDLEKLGLIDEVIPEPEKWAMASDNGSKATAAFDKISKTLKRSLVKHVKALGELSSDELLSQRYAKYRKMGEWQ